MKAVRLPLPTKYENAMLQMREYMLGHYIDDIDVKGDCTACEAVFKMVPREAEQEPGKRIRMTIERLEKRNRQLEVDVERLRLDVQCAEKKANSYMHKFNCIKGEQRMKVIRDANARKPAESYERAIYGYEEKLKKSSDRICKRLSPEKANIMIEIKKLMLLHGLSVTRLAELTARNRASIYNLFSSNVYGENCRLMLLDDVNSVIIKLLIDENKANTG